MMPEREQSEGVSALEVLQMVRDPKNGGDINILLEPSYLHLNVKGKTEFWSKENAILLLFVAKGYKLLTDGKWVTRSGVIKIAEKWYSDKKFEGWSVETINAHLAMLEDLSLLESKSKGKFGKMHYKFSMLNIERVLGGKG